jgi:flagellar biosynthesis chaperone FliJ
VRRFKFSLAAVLRWKVGLRDSALRAFGEATRRRVEAEAQLADARHRQAKLLDAVAQARRGTIAAWAQSSFGSQIAHAESLCDHARERLAHLATQEQAARQVFLDAKRNVEIIEKLNLKRVEQHKLAESRSLELELEEIMLSRLR